MRPRRRLWRRLLLCIGALALILAAIYAYLTNPSRLRARVLAALHTLDLGEVDVTAVTFSPLHGLQLFGVTVDAPADDAGERAAEPAVRVGRAAVSLDWWKLLAGQIRPTAIALGQVSVAIHGQFSGAAESWQLARGEREDPLLAHLTTWLEEGLPPVRIAPFEIRIHSGSDDGWELAHHLRFSFRGTPTRSGYEATVHRGRADGQPFVTLTWERTAGQLAAQFGWTGVDKLELLAPEALSNSLGRVGLSGRVQVKRLLYDLPRDTTDPALPTTIAELTQRLSALKIEFAGLSGDLPIEDAPANAGADHYFRFNDVAATVTYQREAPDAPGRLRWRGHGTINDATLAATATMSAAALDHVRRRLTGSSAETDAAGAFLPDILYGELAIVGLELPTTETGAALLESPRIPHAIQAAFEDYSPRGRIDLTARVLPATPTCSPDDPDRVEVALTARGNRCRYVHFPYDFDDVQGHVRVAGGRVLLEGLRARHGVVSVTANGQLNNSFQWTGFEVEFDAHVVPLDQELYAALPTEYQALWREARPLGLCDVRTTVRRVEGSAETGPAEPDIHVSAELITGSLNLTDGQRISHADGKFTIHNGVIDIADLHGYTDEQSTRVAGTVALTDSGYDSDLHVELTGLPVSHVAPLGYGGDAAGTVTFEGTADVWARVHGASTDPGLSQHAVAEIKSGELWGLQPDARWDDVSGTLIIHDDDHTIEELSCRQGDAMLEVAGRMPSGAVDAEPLELVVEAGAPVLADVLPQFVPADWHALTESLGLDGPGRVRVALEAAPGESPVALIHLRADAMRSDPLPLQLHEVVAELVVSEDRFTLRSSSARYGAEAQLSAQAEGTWGDEALDAEIALTARDMALEQDVLEALPAPLADLLTELSATGRFDADLPRVRLRGAEQRTWNFDGQIALRDASLKLGLDVTDLDGELIGTYKLDADGHATVDARFEIAQAVVAGRQVRDLTGALRWHPGDPFVRLTDLQGQLCGGEVVADVTVDPDTRGYEVTLSLQNTSVHEMFPPTDEDAPPRRGRLDGRLFLSGVGTGIATRRGNGDLRIRGGSFLGTPVLASVAEAEESGGVAISDELDQLDVKFLWEGSTLRLLRIEIQSADLRMIGDGSWDIDADTIALRLVGAHPRGGARVPLLTDLFESAGQELVQYKVEGPLSQPKVTARPLYKLDDTIRALLGAE